jgi:hypothetical protein
MCSRYSANSNGRTIYAPGNMYTNELVRNGTLFNPIPELDEYGGHFSSNPKMCLDCGYKPRPQYSFKFACNTLRDSGAPGSCNCWDPSSLRYAEAALGVPQVKARFDRFE